MRNDQFRETSALRDALRSVTALLPDSWAIHERAGARLGGAQLDMVIDLTGPNGDQVSFVVEAKRSGTVPAADLLRGLRELEEASSLPVLFVSDYIGPSLRETLAAEGISFADATGWVRVVSEDPLVLLTGQGAKRSPRPMRTSAVVRLNGVAASRTIRTLATTSPPIGVRDLASLARVSPGSVSKLLVTLAAEGIVDRNARGGVVAVRRRALIQRWVGDYSFTKANTPVGYYIAPRGLERTLNRMGNADMAVALTGSAAARQLLPTGMTSIVPLRLLALYAASPFELARGLGLIEAEPATANVVIAVPQDSRILASGGEELPLAPVALVIADLLTLPNRSDAEAEQLMDALARDNPAWKD